jgi:stage II sporulation protein AA (anti-sigma F factor antagonist)
MTQDSSRLTVRKDALADGTPVLTLAGALDISNAAVFRDALSELGTPRKTVVDLSAVDYIDSTGLSALGHYRNSLRAVDGSVCLVIASSLVRRVFTITGLNSEFAIVERLEDAASS